MRFEKIKLYGFKDKNKIIDLKFSDAPVSIVYGDNGCGKTSFLRILNAILTKDEQVLIKENINKIEIEVSNENMTNTVTIKKVDRNIYNEKNIVINADRRNTVYSQMNIDDEMKWINYNEVINKYDWSEYDKSGIDRASSILFGVNRGISASSSISYQQIEDYFLTLGRKYSNFERSEARQISRELADYLNRDKIYKNQVYFSRRKKVHEISKKNSVLDKLDMDTVEKIICERYILANHKKVERVQNALFETLSYAIYTNEEENTDIKDIPGNFYENLISNKDKLLEVLNGSIDNKLQKNIINILKKENADKIVMECKKNKLLLNLLVKMIEELNEEESILQSISKLEEIFNSHIAKDKKLVVDGEGVTIRFKNEENNHRINELSSGEKHLLSFLTIFLIEGKERDILMIDEPELSLNIKWQRNILDLLKKLAPKSQIIVASHSPIIGRKNLEYLVELI